MTTIFQACVCRYETGLLAWHLQNSYRYRPLGISIQAFKDCKANWFRCDWVRVNDAQKCWLLAAVMEVCTYRGAPEHRQPALEQAAQCLQSCGAAGEEAARCSGGAIGDTESDATTLHLRLLVRHARSPL